MPFKGIVHSAFLAARGCRLERVHKGVDAKMAASILLSACFSGHSWNTLPINRSRHGRNSRRNWLLQLFMEHSRIAPQAAFSSELAVAL